MYRKIIHGRHSPQICLAMTDRDWLPTRTVYSQKKGNGKQIKKIMGGKLFFCGCSWHKKFEKVELLLSRLPRHINSAKANSVFDTYDFNLVFMLAC